jgi:YD repeat-containing protein
LANSIGGNSSCGSGDNKGPTYTYTPDGKLARRTWARGVTTDYGYTIAGELASVNYSDSTPDVTYTHDHLGRPVTVTDALGQRTFAYDANTLQLISETLPDGAILTRTTDVFGRPAGLALGQDYAVTYGYDSAGRFGSVTTSAPLAPLAVQYAYVQGSDLLAGWSSNVGMSFQRTFEANRDLIASVTNAWNGSAVSSFAYTNDEIGRRTARVDSLSGVPDPVANT